MPKVAPAAAPDAAVRLAAETRKCGAAWAHLGPASWRDAALAVQASSASYGTPQSLAQTVPPSVGALTRTEMKLSSPFPGNDASLEYADMWAEMQAGGGCKHSVLVDESSTDTQVWICAMRTADGMPRLYCSFRGTSSAQDAKTDTQVRPVRKHAVGLMTTMMCNLCQRQSVLSIIYLLPRQGTTL